MLKNKLNSNKKVTKVVMDDNKIDLSSVNKKSNKKTILQNAFARQKGPNRDEVGRFAGGDGGLKSSSSFNLKRALPLIVVVSLVGGLFVFRSFAAGSTTQVTSWYRTCLGREPDPGGLAYWAGRLDKGEAAWTVSAAFMQAGGVSSCNKEDKAVATPTTSTTAQPAQTAQPAGTKAEKKYHQGRSASPDCFSMGNCQTIVNSAYNRLLGRNADESGKNHYATQMLDNGWTIAQVENSLRSTNEYKNYQQKVTTNANSFLEKYKNVSVEEFVARAWQEATGWGARPRDEGGGDKDRDQWVQMIKAGTMTREQLLTKLYESGAGGQHNVRKDDPAYLAAHEKSKAASQAAYQLYMKLIAEKGLTKNNLPEPTDGLPYREDMCEAYVKYYEQGFDVHFGGAGSGGHCFRGLGLNWSATYWEELVSGAMSIGQIEQSMQSGNPGKKVVACTERLAVVIPECGGGALTVSYDLIDQYKKQAEASKSTTPKQSTTSPSSNTAQPTTSAKTNTQTQSKQTTSGSSKTVKNVPAATPVALALATTPKVSMVGVPESLQESTYANVIIAKVSEIEQTVVESFVRAECFEVEDEISSGADDECVSYVQEGLNLSGSDIPVSGYYNSETELEVAEFQKDRNIKAKKLGSVDSKTFVAIKKASEPTIHKSPYAPAKGSLVNNR